MNRAFKREFDLYLDRIRNRTTYNKKLGWLLNSLSSTYFPDYLTFGSFGISPTQKYLNNTISSISPFMWKHIAWPKILKNMNMRFLIPYAAYMKNHSKHIKDIDRLEQKYLDSLYSILEQSPSSIRDSGFTDFFYFISKTLSIWAETNDLSLDCFASQKIEHHDHCSEIYYEIHNEIKAHKNRFLITLLLCTRSNWIDCAEPSVTPFLNQFSSEINDFVDSDEQLSYFKDEHKFFHHKQFDSFLKEKKQTILYESDNCGEFFFDLMLIEYLLENGHTVLLSVKEKPFLNDVTLDDLSHILKTYSFETLETYLDSKKLKIVNSGSAVAGKYVYDVSKDYKKSVKEADIHILKGQGHFQTMPMGQKILKSFSPFHYKKPILYIMGVKADIIDFSLQSVFKNSPKRQSLFLYFYDPKNPMTYPS
ncbi:DUF89 family protein [bacterium]|nr:DUF89 family protein [bacterium]